jgi:hypothetical protein
VVGEGEGDIEGDIAGDSPAAGGAVSPPPQAAKLAAIPKANNRPIAFLFIEFPLVKFVINARLSSIKTGLTRKPRHYISRDPF